MGCYQYVGWVSFCCTFRWVRASAAVCTRASPLAARCPTRPPRACQPPGCRRWAAPRTLPPPQRACHARCAQVVWLDVAAARSRYGRWADGRLPEFTAFPRAGRARTKRQAEADAAAAAVAAAAALQDPDAALLMRRARPALCSPCFTCLRQGRPAASLPALAQTHHACLPAKTGLQQVDMQTIECRARLRACRLGQRTQAGHACDLGDGLGAGVHLLLAHVPGPDHWRILQAPAAVRRLPAEEGAAAARAAARRRGRRPAAPLEQPQGRHGARAWPGRPGTPASILFKHGAEKGGQALVCCRPG